MLYITLLCSKTRHFFVAKRSVGTSGQNYPVINGRYGHLGINYHWNKCKYREPVIMNVDTLTLYNAKAIIVPHRIICSWYIGR